MTRRGWLAGCAGSMALGAAAAPIDRKALVARHNPVVRRVDAFSPLSVGNGEFAFTADVTGLQTIPEAYHDGIPLCTMSQWGWHTKPSPGGAVPEVKPREYDAGGRQVPYLTSSTGQQEAFNWLRENPHRLNLAQIGFVAARAEVEAVEQTLDLWTGVLTSKFTLGGQPVTVRTACHPSRDAIAVQVACQRPAWVKIRFPYGTGNVDASDWSHPASHTTEEVAPGLLRRTLDHDTYFVRVVLEKATLQRASAPHEYLIQAQSSFAFTVEFTPASPQSPPLSSAVGMRDSERGWANFWSTGGAIDLSATDDPRARELERRIVLSQYLTRIQCCGSIPPQETGLTTNSWFGKFHLEMHWWHAAHFPLWGRPMLLERSLGWYSRILPSAREKASWQGYTGARWPKMVGPEGRDSPSPIGPLLIWQQPHPLYFAELMWRAKPVRATAERYREIVFQTAEFMASYARWNETKGRFDLGPPVIPAQENHPPAETWNPTFELEYWRWGLDTALAWRRRLGLPPEPRWARVASKLAPFPQAEGVYLAHENCPQTFSKRQHDHPSMLAAFGMMPGPGIDRAVMKRTLDRVFEVWDWPSTWGWDYPLVAMTATRLGDPDTAVKALLLDTPKNRYLVSGHNWQRDNLPLYLPGNGGLLAATAQMAVSNGFPPAWKARVEGLSGLL